LKTAQQRTLPKGLCALAGRAGDFIDRGAWGVETLLLVSALKLALPGSVTLLRGNHESSTCTSLYGFKTELLRKYMAEVRSRGHDRAWCVHGKHDGA
jgi:hypothetical protein